MKKRRGILIGRWLVAGLIFPPGPLDSSQYAYTRLMYVLMYSYLMIKGSSQKSFQHPGDPSERI